MIADLVSMLLIVSAVFFEDYQLKDKYWQLITKILDQVNQACQEILRVKPRHCANFLLGSLLQLL